MRPGAGVVASSGGKREADSMTITQSSDLDGWLLQVLITPEGQANPYPYYTLMREEARVSRTSFGPYVVNGYDECQSVLRDPRLGRGMGIEGASAGIFGENGTRRGEFFEVSQHNMLLADPPDHTRLRRLVSRSFTPRQMERLRPAVHALVAGLLDGHGREGRRRVHVRLCAAAAHGGHRRAGRCAVVGLVRPPTSGPGRGARHRAGPGLRGDRRRHRGHRGPGRVLLRLARRPAAQPTRRPAELARRGLGERRPADRRGGGVDRHPALRRRLRDDDQPPRQRPPRPAHPPGAAGGLARPPRHRANGRRGTVAVRQPGAIQPAHGSRAGRPGR